MNNILNTKCIKFIAFDIDGVLYSSENFLADAYLEGINLYLKNSDFVKKILI